MNNSNQRSDLQDNKQGEPEISIHQPSARLDRLAWLLDNSIRLPGGLRIGLDGLIGLIPGVGDAATALLSGFIVLESYRLGAPRSLLVRMLGNVGLEFVIGSVPLIGDAFDMAFKANARNVALLHAYQAGSPTPALTAGQTSADNATPTAQSYSHIATPDDDRTAALARRKPWLRRILLAVVVLIAIALASLSAYAFFNFSIAIIGDVLASVG